MTFAQTMRLIWIDAMLTNVGTIQRADIARMFLISIPQASADLQAYRRAHPKGLIYDARAKCYRRSGSESLFDRDARNAVGLAAQEIRHWACIDICGAA